MLRNLPRLSYSGLTIVLSNVSRFDKTSLLSAKAGELVNNYCLRPQLNVMQCDVRLADDPSPWLSDTKCVILCGEYAMHKYCPSTRENVLNEMRGSPLLVSDKIPAIATFFPQDATDVKSHEQNLNEESKEYVGLEESNFSGDEDDEGDVKRFSNTKRSNYSFWVRRDFWKGKQILASTRWGEYKKPVYKVFPGSDEVINILTKTKGQWMDFDIETDYEQQNLLCFSFTFDGSTIYCVPVLDNNYLWSYSSLHHVMRALAVAIRDNILVAHNGAAFDFLVLGYKYRIPIPNKTWDTMIAMHRCFPDIEKSLGHCTSYWLNESFHKDTDSRAYFTRQHMMDKLLYCGKDVYTMSCVRKEMQKYAKTIPGLEASIACAMDSIRPYTICSLQGISYSETLRRKKVEENDRLMMQYMRMIRLLIGTQGMEDLKKIVKGKYKNNSLPNSNKQCCEYFHNMLGYPVVMRNLPDKNGVRHPSLAKRAMLKLRLKHENPVIDLINAFRYTRLEGTTPLGFLPWKDDKGQIIDPTTYDSNPLIQPASPSQKELLLPLS